tara:strand:+ start:371 stop:1162 length:792 start_codon:yes stop_codon:yes gene_type:complete
MKVSDLVQELKVLYPKLRPSTFACWDKSIKPIAHLPVESINKAAVERYRIQSLQELSESTVVTRMGYCKAIWTKALRWEKIEGKNVWEYGDDGLEKKERDPEYRPWEFWEEYHEHPWFRFLWYSGARIGEIAGLDPKNIVMNAKIPYFNFVHQPNRMLKNDASVRKVPIHPSCFNYIDRFVMTKAKGNHGHKWSWEMGDRLGLPPGEAAHSLRHAFHTQCRDNETEEYMLDILTGHAKKSVTARYGRTGMHLLKKEIYKFAHH